MPVRRSYDPKLLTILDEDKIELEETECLTTYDRVPLYLREGFVWNGYRVNYSFTRSLRSLTELHNETMNVWTHLFMAGVCAYWLATAVARDELCSIDDVSDYADMRATLHTHGRETAVSQPRWPLYVYLCSAVYLLLCSTAYHLFASMSKSWHFFFRSMDYSGISILIGGSFVPAIYYHNELYLTWRLIYVGLFVFVCFLSALLPLTRWFHRAEFRNQRPLVFLAVGVLGMMPIVHKIAVYGRSPVHVLPLRLMGLSGGSFIVGAIVYVIKVPEVLAPGWFDYVCASHSVWHLFVMSGVYWHYYAMLYLFEQAHFARTEWSVGVAASELCK